MNRFAAVVLSIAALSGLTVGPAMAVDTAATIDALATIRSVGHVNVIDVGARYDRFIFAKRAMGSNAPLTPLQAAIAGNPTLVAAIERVSWSFDLKSVYSATVQGDSVYLYMDNPPP
jgi:hypothetical protein